MLTEVACRKAAASDKPYKLADSARLCLYVTPTGFKSWRMKYRVGATEKRLVFGSYPEVSLREARDLRDAARRQIRDGRDPSVERKKDRASRLAGSARTMQRFAEDWDAARKSTWTPTYAKAVLGRLEHDVFPALDSVPIGDVTAPMVLGMLQQIERQGSLMSFGVFDSISPTSSEWRSPLEPRSSIRQRASIQPCESATEASGRRFAHSPKHDGCLQAWTRRTWSRQRASRCAS